jgi:hypothetical protein
MVVEAADTPVEVAIPDVAETADSLTNKSSRTPPASRRRLLFTGLSSCHRYPKKDIQEIVIPSRASNLLFP